MQLLMTARSTLAGWVVVLGALLAGPGRLAPTDAQPSTGTYRDPLETHYLGDVARIGLVSIMGGAGFTAEFDHVHVHRVNRGGGP